jgi:peptidoglycan/LPS O-acetylase OafA/YrhL
VLCEPYFGSAPGFWLAFPAVMVLASAFAWLGYHLVEVPRQALGRRVIERI